MARFAWWAWGTFCTAIGIVLVWLMFRALDGSTAMFCIGCQGGARSSSPPEPHTEPAAESSTRSTIEYSYIRFFRKVVLPIAKRDGVTHTGGNCASADDDMLCVECFTPMGEVWSLCDLDGCSLLATNDEMKAGGADPGACERRADRNNMIVEFTRGAW